MPLTKTIIQVPKTAPQTTNNILQTTTGDNAIKNADNLKLVSNCAPITANNPPLIKASNQTASNPLPVPDVVRHLPAHNPTISANKLPPNITPEIYPRGITGALNKLEASLTFRKTQLEQNWDNQAQIDFKNSFGNTDEDTKNQILNAINKLLDSLPKLTDNNFDLLLAQPNGKDLALINVDSNDANRSSRTDDLTSKIIKINHEIFKKYEEYPLAQDANNYQRFPKSDKGEAFLSQTWLLACGLADFVLPTNKFHTNLATGAEAHVFAHNWNPNKKFGSFDPNGFAYYLEYSNMQALNGKISSTPALDEFTTNLSRKAKEGNLSPAWGREKEIDAIIAALCAGQSPVLVGEAGVGKTATIEGLAQKIQNGKVPEQLKNAEIRVLDIGKLTSGTDKDGETAQNLGVIDKRIGQLIKELEANNTKPILLFIDELHRIRGAGASSESRASGLDQQLKEGLGRSAFRIIGATTHKEYQDYIGALDDAVARRFEKTPIDEPNPETAVTMMRALAQQLTNKHKIYITDKAANAAVKYAQEYYSQGKLPDTSTKLLRAAISKAIALQSGSTPLAIQTLEGQIAFTKMQIIALNKDKEHDYLDEDGNEKVIHAEQTLQRYQQELDSLNARWQQESILVQGILKLHHQIDEIKFNSDQKTALTNQLKQLKQDLQTIQQNGLLIPTEVNEQLIAQIVSEKTNIPAGQITLNEIERLTLVREEMKKQVVGQDHAIDTLIDRILTTRSGFKNKDNPVNVFFLAGPSGTGKSSTARVLADMLYAGKLTQINLNQYNNPHDTSKLEGAPPGYIGFDRSTLLDGIRNNPRGVLLLDEFEKADEKVQQFFLNIFETGKMQDPKSAKTIDFTNLMIIVTANTGAEAIQKAFLDKNNPPLLEDLEMLVIEELTKNPKLIPLAGRMEVVPYHPISDTAQVAIVEKTLNELKIQFIEKYPQVASIDFDEKLITILANEIRKKKDLGTRALNPMMGKLSTTINKKLLSSLMQKNTKQKLVISCTYSESEREFFANVVPS